MDPKYLGPLLDFLKKKIKAKKSPYKENHECLNSHNEKKNLIYIVATLTCDTCVPQLPFIHHLLRLTFMRNSHIFAHLIIRSIDELII